jgi:hypothetical protein
MAKGNYKKKKKEELSSADIERMELLQKASEKVGKQLSINTEKGNLEEVDELRKLLGKEFEDPEESTIYIIGV